MRTKGGTFIKLEHVLLNSAAWHALSASERALLIHIWSRHNGRNNGDLGCGRREVQQEFGCGDHQAVRWLRNLREKGFIVAATGGSFNRKTGARRATRWRLTMEPCDGKPPTRDYMRWAPGGAEEEDRIVA